MKKFIFSFVLLFGSAEYVFSQYYGDSVQYYVGTTIQLKPDKSLSVFILKEKNRSLTDKESLYMPSKQFGSDVESLRNSKFYIESIENQTKTAPSSLMGIYPYLFTVKELSTNQTFYIPYPKLEGAWAFEVVDGVKINFDDFVCKTVSVSKDKFTDVVTYRFNSPNSYFTKSGDMVFLSLKTNGNIARAVEKGVYLLYGDGTRKHFPNAEVKCEVNEISPKSFKFIYSSTLFLSKSDVQEIAEKGITDFRLYIDDGTFSKEKQKIIKAQAKCLLSK